MWTCGGKRPACGLGSCWGRGAPSRAGLGSFPPLPSFEGVTPDEPPWEPWGRVVGVDTKQEQECRVPQLGPRRRGTEGSFLELEATAAPSQALQAAG